MSLPPILFCACTDARVFPPAAADAVRRELQAAGQPFWEVADLCGMAARKDARLREVASEPVVRVVACFPRAVQWLFAAAGAPLPPQARVFNLRVQSAEAIAAALLADVPAAGVGQGAAAPVLAPVTTGSIPEAAAPGVAPVGWRPWFPVIDADSCVQCLQCLSFCLFGVFGTDADRRVRVEHPENCKTNCPACARVCPEGAILFPKYHTGPINGAPVPPGGERREAVKVDISALLGGDVHARLRERSGAARTRFSKDRDAEAARQERQKCLDALLANTEIPSEVWRSLPSAEELKQRAEQARAKAQAALERPGPA